jgi:hypothetical protein
MIKEERREETGGEKGGTESLGIGDGSFGAEDEPDVRTYRWGWESYLLLEPTDGVCQSLLLEIDEDEEKEYRGRSWYLKSQLWSLWPLMMAREGMKRAPMRTGPRLLHLRDGDKGHGKAGQDH